MFRNYLKIAFRNFRKEKVFTSLNLIGLSTAFGISLLLCMYSLFELSYDQFHKNKDTIYQIYTNQETPRGTESSEVHPIPFAEAFKSEIPGVKKITRLTTGGPSVDIDSKKIRINATWIDPDFFSIFSFPIIAGNTANPLPDKNAVALTQEAATRLFGDENPLGKIFTLQQNNEQTPVTVTAILEDLPMASSIRFEALFHFSNLLKNVYADKLDRWDHHNHKVFMELEQDVSKAQLEASTKAFANLHYATDISDAKRDGAQANSNGDYMQIKLLSIADRSFISIKNHILTINKTLQYLILGIAFLILFIASVNFINMSIAKSSWRLREIGMRKTLGASKVQLFLQFWGESVLIFTIAVILGVGIAILLLDPFQNLFKTKASFNSITQPLLIVGLFIGLWVITLLAGGYPALLLSKLGTLQALKGKLQITGKNTVRNSLLVIQFSITIILIGGTLVIWNQVEYMRSKDLGYDKEQLLSFPLQNTKNPQQTLTLLRNELADQPNILSISGSRSTLGIGRDESTSTSAMGFDHQGREVVTNIFFVDYDYPETLGLALTTGRSFNKAYATDSLSVIINEAMAKQFTEKNPLDIILNIDDTKFTVIGVLKDFNFQKLDKKIAPLSLFMNDAKRLRYAYVRVAPSHLAASYDLVQKAWSTIAPDREFLGSFLDENIDRTLRKERKMTTMIASASVLAIIISCIGLFALSLLAVTQRRKEIGIRKVVGASVSVIALLLSKEFLKLVGVAFLIATPLSWFITSRWLQNYTYHIDLGFWIFATAGGITTVIALVTISIHTLNAATQNPVNSLKSE